MNSARWLFTIWIFTSSWVCALTAGEARVVLDVPYVVDGDPAQRLDVRIPAGEGPFPVVILVHGGGWSSGDKSGAERPRSGADITPWFAPLSEAGFLAVSINYRLAPVHRWPACLDDTRTAVRWVREHVAEYGGDPGRLAIMGHSAGGHLALYAAIPAAGETGSPVQAVVGCAAVSDLVSDTRRRGGPSASLQMLFDLPPEVGPGTYERLSEVSPQNLVVAGYPPTLLLHGDQDKTVPLGQSQAFQARLLEIGTACDLHVLTGAAHRLTEWADHDPDWAKILTDWLSSQLSRSYAAGSFSAER